MQSHGCCRYGTVIERGCGLASWYISDVLQCTTRACSWGHSRERVAFGIFPKALQILWLKLAEVLAGFLCELLEMRANKGERTRKEGDTHCLFLSTTIMFTSNCFTRVLVHKWSTFTCCAKICLDAATYIILLTILSSLVSNLNNSSCINH